MAENNSHVEPCRICKWEIPPGYLSQRGYCARCENDGYNQKRSDLITALMSLQNVLTIAEPYDTRRAR